MLVLDDNRDAADTCAALLELFGHCAQEPGFDEHLTKPVAAEAIEAALRKTFECRIS